MSDQSENISTVEENEPIYYKPRVLNLVATISGILSWVVLVGFLANVVVQVLSIRASIASAVAQGQAVSLTTMLGEPAFNAYVFTTLIIPLLLGLSLFVMLLGLSIGLNALLEIDFNFREPKE